MEEGTDSMTTQAVSDAALRIAERFGVPCVILAAMLWMTREAATSLHNSVVVPMVKSHTEFLDSTRVTLQQISQTQDKQADTLEELAKGQDEIRHAVIKATQEK
jgi:flagellar hook-basal body complex protein FliE